MTPAVPRPVPEPRTDPTPSKEDIRHTLWKAVQPVGCHINGLEHVYAFEGHPQGVRLVLTIGGRKPVYVGEDFFPARHNYDEPCWPAVEAIIADIDARKKGHAPAPSPFRKPAASAAGRVERAAHRAQAEAPPALPDPLLGALAWVWVPRLKDYRPGTINRLNPDGTVGIHLHARPGGEDAKLKDENFTEVRLFDPDDQTPRAGRWAVLSRGHVDVGSAETPRVDKLESAISELIDRVGYLEGQDKARLDQIAALETTVKGLQSELGKVKAKLKSED